jgi:hypothetical protein
MIEDEAPSSHAPGAGTVLKFHQRESSRRSLAPAASPVEDLAKYQHGAEADDYRHRMMVNAAAFVFVLALIGAGLWLADSMAKLRRNQDCVLAGHRNCAPIEVHK